MDTLTPSSLAHTIIVLLGKMEKQASVIVRENQKVTDRTIDHKFSNEIASLEKEKSIRNQNQVRVLKKKDMQRHKQIFKN